MMTHFCENCGRDFSNRFCPRCGGLPSTYKSEPEPVSDLGDTLDAMIEQASRPTLASLLKKGISSGLIQPTNDYAGGVKPE